MKKLVLPSVSIFLIVLTMASCEPKLDLNAYANKIEAGLKDNCLGYAFVVSKLGEPSVKRAGGWARRSQDRPELAMSPDVKYATASVSKNITATAFLKLLDDQPQELTLDEKLNEKIVDYLPFNWTPGKDVNTITFRELLQHRSGIRPKDDGSCQWDDYANLKSCLALPLDVSQKNVGCNGKPIGCYNNVNYALFRIIIPVMLGKIVKPAQTGLSEDEIDHINDALAADVYMKYVNDNVFAKAGLSQIFCKPTDGFKQGLSYKYAAADGPGTDFGDKTLLCGSQGWFLSAAELAKYFQALNEGYKIVPAVIPARMRAELLGYDGFADANTKVARWYKVGGYPLQSNEINTALVKFSNNVEVALIMNSDPTNGFNYGVVIRDSMTDLLNGK